MNQQPFSAPPPIYNYYYGARDQRQIEELSTESVNNTKVQNSLEILDCYILGIFILQLIISLLLAAIAIWFGLDPLHKNKCNCQCIGLNMTSKNFK